MEAKIITCTECGSVVVYDRDKELSTLSAQNKAYREVIESVEAVINHREAGEITMPVLVAPAYVRMIERTRALTTKGEE